MTKIISNACAAFMQPKLRKKGGMKERKHVALWEKFTESCQGSSEWLAPICPSSRPSVRSSIHPSVLGTLMALNSKNKLNLHDILLLNINRIEWRGRCLKPWLVHQWATISTNETTFPLSQLGSYFLLGCNDMKSGDKRRFEMCHFVAPCSKQEVTKLRRYEESAWPSDCGWSQRESTRVNPKRKPKSWL